MLVLGIMNMTLMNNKYFFRMKLQKNSHMAKTLRTVLVKFLELCVVVCIFDEFIERCVYFDGKNYRIFFY